MMIRIYTFIHGARAALDQGEEVAGELVVTGKRPAETASICRFQTPLFAIGRTDCSVVSELWMSWWWL